MKKLVFILLAAILLSACSPIAPAESAPSESSPPEFSGEPSAEESAAAGETALAPVRTLDGDYETMVPTGQETGITPPLSHGESARFYAVRSDGMWGLIDEHGTELLPCIGEKMPILCGMGHWSWLSSDSRGEQHEKFADALEQATGYPLCPGHGANFYQIYAESPETPPQIYWGSDGSRGSRAVEAGDTRGDAFFPTEYTALIDNRGDPPTLAPGGCWNFADLEGNVLCPDEEFDRAGWFSGEALAPVQQDGKWAYVDTEGKFATGFVYESCWGSKYAYSEDTGEYPCCAYSLWEGYAPVVRDGKWGVLDETGEEIIPCQYEGGAPYPGGAWLKSDGRWSLYLLD